VMSKPRRWSAYRIVPNAILDCNAYHVRKPTAANVPHHPHITSSALPPGR
jgi:hypothetical protein